MKSWQRNSVRQWGILFPLTPHFYLNNLLRNISDNIYILRNISDNIYIYIFNVIYLVVVFSGKWDGITLLASSAINTDKNI